MKSLKQPSATHSTATGDAERMDLSQMLQEIDLIERSLDIEHVMLHAGWESPFCPVWSHSAIRLNGYGFKAPGRDACAFEILKIASA
jgi:hypothetical protein